MLATAGRPLGLPGEGRCPSGVLAQKEQGCRAAEREGDSSASRCQGPAGTGVRSGACQVQPGQSKVGGISLRRLPESWPTGAARSWHLLQLPSAELSFVSLVNSSPVLEDAGDGAGSSVQAPVPEAGEVARSLGDSQKGHCPASRQGRLQIGFSARLGSTAASAVSTHAAVLLQLARHKPRMDVLLLRREGLV